MGHPIFAPDLDAVHVLKEVGHQHRLTYPQIEWYKRNRDVGSFDELYGEEEVQDLLSGTKYNIPAHIHVNPPSKMWEAWGLVTRRDIRVVFAVQVLRDGYWDATAQPPAVAPYPYVEIGDLVVILGQTFTLTDVFRRDYHGNTTVPTKVHCFGLKVRRTWAPGGDTVDIGEDDTDGTLPPPTPPVSGDDDDLF
jgi:hypothetical protein